MTALGQARAATWRTSLTCSSPKSPTSSTMSGCRWAMAAASAVGHHRPCTSPTTAIRASKGLPVQQQE
jgi:hypothetical protein